MGDFKGVVMEQDNKALAGLEKALGELHSYINAIKEATFPGKKLEDGAKLLKFLQDNFKTLQKQHQDLSEKILERVKEAQAKDVTPKSEE